MTPAQVETQARRRYNSVSDTTFYSQDEVYQYIFEAEMELATRAKLIEGRDTSITTTASDQTYEVPDGFFEVSRLEYDGDKIQKIEMREDDTVTIGNSDTTSTGSP